MTRQFCAPGCHAHRVVLAERASAGDIQVGLISVVEVTAPFTQRGLSETATLHIQCVVMRTSENSILNFLTRAGVAWVNLSQNTYTAAHPM
jgi:hypothetical protein